MQNLRSQFPILKRRINGKPLVYLDNAATTQKPQAVITATTDYYATINANVHRGIYALSEEATAAYEGARETIARFIVAIPKEVVFTRNATDSINLVARSLTAGLRPNDEILITQMEHHSNIVPWQQLAKRTRAMLKILPITDEGRWGMDQLQRLLTPRTKVVAVCHASNVLGTINPVGAMVRAAHEAGAIVVVDGAQAIAHLSVNVRVLDCDFYAFSGHKLYGPTGIGVLYGKENLLEQMEPITFGGDMVKTVEWTGATWNDIPWRFEAGTPNVEGVIGLAAAVTWLKPLGMDRIERDERELTEYALARLKEIPEITIQGPATAQNRIGVISFTLANVHPHDLATILDERGVAIRAGHHCAMPLMTRLGVAATARASLAVYNSKKDIDQLVAGLEDAIRIFTPKVTVTVPKKNLWQR